MIYIVSWVDYEEYIPLYVEGPEQADWQGFCQALMPEAGRRAIDKSNSLRSEDHPRPPYVGMNDVVEALVDILCERGYRRLKITEAKFFGSGIIGGFWRSGRDKEEAKLLSNEVYDLISKHNDKVERGN